MKTVYKCEYCEDIFVVAEDCIEHETNDCDENPKVKTCDTCKCQRIDCPNGGRLYYSCTKGHMKTGPVSHTKHCEFWDYDNGYAHP